MALNASTIDTQNAKLSFEVKKLGILTIKGKITDLNGEVAFGKDSLEDAHFNVCISAVTIDTGNPKRDEHLKSKDFFYVNEHPKICFQSTSVKRIDDHYQAFGKLTMLGITNSVTIPFSFINGVFTGQFVLNRSDFNLGKKFPTFIVGKNIKISIDCKIKN